MHEMRLIFSALEDMWVVRSDPAGDTLIELPDVAGTGLRAGKIIRLPLSLQAWQAGELHREVPADAQVRELYRVEHRTRTGWPALLIGSELVDREGRQLMLRLHAFYTFFDRAAAAHAWGVNAERFQHYAQRCLEVLLSASPQWRDPGIVALAQV